MNDFESNVSTEINKFIEKVKELAKIETDKMTAMLQAADAKIREAEGLKILKDRLEKQKEEQDMQDAFLKKREQADKDRKLKLDDQEAAIAAEKQRLSNLLTS